MIFVLLQLWSLVITSHAIHYKGGSITWKPIDPYTNSSTVAIIVYQTHSWTLSRFRCNQTLIDTLGSYLDGGFFYNEPQVACQPTAGSCTGTGWILINEPTFCTDFSTAVQISSGSLIKKVNLARTTNIRVGFASSAWATEIRTNTGAAASSWSVMTRIDLTQKYPINSSPVTGSLPIIRVIEGQTATIQIPVADWDVDDDIRCRWASNSGAAGNECGDVCSNLPSAVLNPSSCTITWLAVRRPYDISGGRMTSSYIVAIMVEDFVNTASTTPMSSVPLQMIVYTYRPATGACSIIPAVIGDRPNRACIGVPINVTLVERIVAKVYCTGDTIVQFVTTSPLYMRKTAIAPVAGTTDQWFITLTWTPTQDQKGPQVFCAAPIDQNGLTGSQHCVNFVVGYSAPNLITPTLIQGSASPLGTVFSNHSIFSIQATGGVYHPNRNGTYIQIFNRLDPLLSVWEADCGYSPNCIYSGSTVLIYVPNANWTYGAHYYILFSSGAASGNVFCAPESAPITNPNFWNFNIWDPGYSSTTASTSAPPTTVTVTTRAMLTTTPIANLTTTGIVVTPGSNVSVTSLISATSTTTMTTATTQAPTIATIPPVSMLSAKDLEEQCRQPVAIANALSMIALLPVHVLGMFAMFTKLEKMFNPARVAANIRGQNIKNRVNSRTTLQNTMKG